jgi:hypothetical protein
MKKEVEEKLVDMLNWAEGALKTGSDFVVEQTPLYIQELLIYNFWASLTWFVISFICFIITIYATYRLVSYFVKNDNGDALPFTMFLVFPILFSVMGMEKNTDWFKIKVAPRVYIVDYLRTELKN